MKFNISNPSGFPEFSPRQEAVRQQWLEQIRQVFRQNGFIFIDTPLVEREENLLGKGGNPKEIYALKRIHDEAADTSHSGNALRFDQTVPLALYVARHRNELVFPFRRAVIGPVFRGERAQKGRFRQFDQCDIDVIGSGSLSLGNDAQVVGIIIELFQRLLPGVGFQVQLNNRKILLGFFQDVLGVTDDQIKPVLDIVDDLEKIGRDAVIDKLKALEIDSEKIEQLFALMNLGGTPSEILEALEKIEAGELFVEGVSELSEVVQMLQNMGVDEGYYKIDLRIARGLDYYTGTVYETKLTDYPQVGSVCSGGRYEDLAAIFTGQKLPGVGISIGLTRLLSQVFEHGILAEQPASPSQVLVVTMDEVEPVQKKALELGAQLRSGRIAAENYFESKKPAKKFEYAQKLEIPYVLVIGENELAAGEYQIKSMATGEKVMVAEDKLVDWFLF